VKIWIGFFWLRYEPVAGCCDYVMKVWGWIKTSVSWLGQRRLDPLEIICSVGLVVR